MKKLNLTLLALLTLGLAFTSCKKDDNDDPQIPNNNNNNNNQNPTPEPTVEELLVNKNWKIYSVELDEPVVINGNTISDLFLFFDECQKDDYFLFNDDYTGLQGTGSNICDVEEDIEFTWELNSDNDKELVVDRNGTEQVYKIVSISKKTLIFESLENVNGQMVPAKVYME